MKLLTGLLTGSATAVTMGLIVAATMTAMEADPPAAGTTTVVPDSTVAPDSAGPEDREYLSQKASRFRPKNHRLDRKNSTPAPTGPTTGSTSDAGSGSGETRVSAYVTGYSYWDNTPPGSSAISHPRIHRVAGGVGNYADPITVAVGHDMSSGSDVLDWSAGTRFYLPYLRRYFIVEDTCGDGSTPEDGPCHTGYPSAAVTWLDIWVGGQHADRATSDACMSRITDVHTAIKDPAADYRVSAGEVTDGCATYGETPVR